MGRAFESWTRQHSVAPLLWNEHGGSPQNADDDARGEALRLQRETRTRFLLWLVWQNE